MTLKRGGSIGHFESSSLSLLWGAAGAHGGVLAKCGVGGAGPRLLVAHDGKVTWNNQIQWTSLAAHILGREIIELSVLKMV